MAANRVNVSKGQLISDLDARLQMGGLMVAADLGETTARIAGDPFS